MDIYLGIGVFIGGNMKTDTIDWNAFDNFQEEQYVNDYGHLIE